MLWACAEKNNVLPAPDPDPENPGTQIGHRMGNGEYATFAGICAELKAQGYGFMVLETAYTFTLGNDAAGKWAGDWMKDVL